MNYLGITIIIVFGMSIIFLFSTVGSGSSLITSSGIQKIDTLHVNDLSGYGIIGVNPKAADNITAPDIIFSTTVPDNSLVEIWFYNNNGVQIGYGSGTISPAGTSITISIPSGPNRVTAAERATLTTINVGVT